MSSRFQAAKGPVRLRIGHFTFVQAVADGQPMRCFFTDRPLYAIPGGGRATEHEIRRALAKAWGAVPHRMEITP